MAEITGKAADQIAPRTRASMDGSVAQDLTFDQFLKNKPPAFADEMLGKGRADLWRSGKITLSQLLDQRGNPLTLTQLENKYGKPWHDGQTFLDVLIASWCKGRANALPAPEGQQ